MKKLKLENENLSRKWYQNPQWYSVIMPSLFGIATILIAIFSGYLNNQSLVNKNENILNKIESTNLKNEIQEFRSEKLMLLAHNTSLKSTSDSLVNLITKREARVKELEKMYATLRESFGNESQKVQELIEEYEASKNNYESKISALTHENGAISLNSSKNRMRLEDEIERLRSELSKCKELNN